MALHGSSGPTVTQDGAAFPWILEHLLAYPGTYEIPLRTMYTLNSTPSTVHHPRQSIQPGTPSLSSTASSPDSSPASPEFPPDQQHQPPFSNAAEHFRSCLMSHISKIPSQPFSLPPAFITSFVRRCFTADLCLVDFTQALTALDYLRALENRRNRELSLALQRLQLNKKYLENAEGDISPNPKISEWVLNMHDKERKVENLYTHVYIGLRKWTLINEMRLEPFSKANCIAMLNTLYPPATASSPTRQLTPHLLESQRKGIFRYIQAVERNGRGVLKNLEEQGKQEGDSNGWAVLREIVDKYLRTANGVIEECMEITGPDHFDPEIEARRRGDRRADSGVSFASNDRPSTNSSSSSKQTSPVVEKPLPNTSRNTSPTVQQPVPKKTRTTLEKIARELRNLRSRNEVKEISGAYSAEPMKSAKSRAIKRMKSTSSIGSKSKHSRNNSEETVPDFKIDEQKRQLAIWEAQRRKQQKDEDRGPRVVGFKAQGRSFDLER